LDGGAERPQVHAVGADADGPAAAAGAEGQDLVEAVEQAGPLLLADEPLELGAVDGELGPGEPLGEGLQRLFLQGGGRLDRPEAVPGLRQQIHVVSSPPFTETPRGAPPGGRYSTALLRLGQPAGVGAGRAAAR